MRKRSPRRVARAEAPRAAGRQSRSRTARATTVPFASSSAPAGSGTARGAAGSICVPSPHSLYEVTLTTAARASARAPHAVVVAARLAALGRGAVPRADLLVVVPGPDRRHEEQAARRAERRELAASARPSRRGSRRRSRSTCTRRRPPAASSAPWWRSSHSPITNASCAAPRAALAAARRARAPTPPPGCGTSHARGDRAAADAEHARVRAVPLVQVREVERHALRRTGRGTAPRWNATFTSVRAAASSTIAIASSAAHALRVVRAGHVGPPPHHESTTAPAAARAARRAARVVAGSRDEYSPRAG